MLCNGPEVSAAGTCQPGISMFFKILCRISRILSLHLSPDVSEVSDEIGIEEISLAAVLAHRPHDAVRETRGSAHLIHSRQQRAAVWSLMLLLLQLPQLQFDSHLLLSVATVRVHANRSNGWDRGYYIPRYSFSFN